MPAASVRIATFYLKTSGGDLLTALAQSYPAGSGPTGSTTVGGREIICRVFKDQNIQEIEFSRTYGFDRTPGSKPYLLY